MNKLPLLLLILSIGFYVNGQGIDLQLNQVIYLDAVELSTWNAAGTNYNIHSVPEGKIWKITACSSSGGGSYGNNSYFYIMNPDSIASTHYVASSGTSTGTTGHSMGSSGFPTWLPEGYGIRYGAGVEGVSILEFNAVSQ